MDTLPTSDPVGSQDRKDPFIQFVRVVYYCALSLFELHTQRPTHCNSPYFIYQFVRWFDWGSHFWGGPWTHQGLSTIAKSIYSPTEHASIFVIRPPSLAFKTTSISSCAQNELHRLFTYYRFVFWDANSNNSWQRCQFDPWEFWRWVTTSLPTGFEEWRGPTALRQTTRIS